MKRNDVNWQNTKKCKIASSNRKEADRKQDFLWQLMRGGGGGNIIINLSLYSAYNT